MRATRASGSPEHGKESRSVSYRTVYRLSRRPRFLRWFSVGRATTFWSVPSPSEPSSLKGSRAPVRRQILHRSGELSPHRGDQEKKLRTFLASWGASRQSSRRIRRSRAGARCDDEESAGLADRRSARGCAQTTAFGAVTLPGLPGFVLASALRVPRTEGYRTRAESVSVQGTVVPAP